MVDDRTGKPIAPQRLIPTWVIFFFDRLDHDYHVQAYRLARQRAWNWIVNSPLKTYQWDAQFEDIQLRERYVNLAREQACDVAVLLMNDKTAQSSDLEQAEELLRFAEDQFVVWARVKDVAGWKKAMPQRRKNCEVWITPCVLEQYACYDPVARSSAILINAYLKAHDVTHKPIYLAKARALGNGMLAGQQWMAESHKGNGEIPTWNMKRQPINWLNNSFYAAEAILNLSREK
jgi:maltose/maltodextrin transport system substrate-binding protein